MERILTSHRFLAATAACCGVAAGLAAWAAHDASRGARAAAVLIALGSTLAVLLMIAWALAGDGQETVVEAPVPPSEPPVVAAAPADPRRRELEQLLEEGRALREQVSTADARVDAWIEQTRQAIEQCRPGVAGYFNALAARRFPDDGSRLDAHVKRLGTIVRDV